MTKEEICKELNGREIVWAVDKLRLKCVVLAQLEYNKVSIKPLDKPEKVLKHLKKVGYANYTLDVVKDPKFCVCTLRFDANQEAFDLLIAVCKTGVIKDKDNETIDKCLAERRNPFFDNSPSCPYGG